MRRARRALIAALALALAGCASDPSPAPGESGAEPSTSAASEARDLGVELDGLTVRSVRPDTPAARARVEEGDEIVSFDGERVRDAAALDAAVTAAPCRTRMVVRRGEQELMLPVDF